MLAVTDGRGPDGPYRGQDDEAAQPETGNLSLQLVGSAPTPRAPLATAAAGRRRRVVDLVPAARLRWGRPLWVLAGLLLGLTAGGSAVVLRTLHQPVVQARTPMQPAAGPSLPGGQAQDATGPGAAARFPGGRTGTGPVVTQDPAAAGPLPTPAPVPTAAPSPEPSATVGGSPSPARGGVLYSGSGTLMGAACIPADCSALTSPTAHVRYQLGHTSCATSTVITLTLTSASANKSTFTVSDTGSSGLIDGQAAPFHAEGPFFVRLQTTSPCSYDLTLRS